MPDASPYKGTLPVAAFVLAFVKRDELCKFLIEQQPIKAIARHYDRNEDTVARAIKILREHEIDIVNGNVPAVAMVIWRGILGWERCKSYHTAKTFIERGELAPKGTGGPKRKIRRKAVSAEQGGAPAVAAVPVAPMPPVAPAVTPPPRTIRPSPSSGEPDDVLADLQLSMPLVQQARTSADSHR